MQIIKVFKDEKFLFFTISFLIEFYSSLICKCIPHYIIMNDLIKTSNTLNKPLLDCVNQFGKKIYNPDAYSKTGASMYSKTTGKKIHNWSQFKKKNRRKKIINSALLAVKLNPLAKAFTYVSKLEGDKIYIGYTTNPVKRIRDHLNGRGAKVTSELEMHNVTLIPHMSIEEAKKAERALYYKQKKLFGYNNVRGAGNTKRFSLSKHH